MREITERMWEKAIESLRDEITDYWHWWQAHNDAQVYKAYETCTALETRYLKGERTPELYKEMTGVHQPKTYCKATQHNYRLATTSGIRQLAKDKFGIIRGVKVILYCTRCGKIKEVIADKHYGDGSIVED